MTNVTHTRKLSRSTHRWPKGEGTIRIQYRTENTSLQHNPLNKRINKKQAFLLDVNNQFTNNQWNAKERQDGLLVIDNPPKSPGLWVAIEGASLLPEGVGWLSNTSQSSTLPITTTSWYGKRYTHSKVVTQHTPLAERGRNNSVFNIAQKTQVCNTIHSMSGNKKGNKEEDEKLNKNNPGENDSSNGRSWVARLEYASNCGYMRVGTKLYGGPTWNETFGKCCVFYKLCESPVESDNYTEKCVERHYWGKH